MDILELLTVNAIIAGMAALIEFRSGARTSSMPLLYDNLELLKPGRQEELLRDISERMGRPAERVEVEEVDLLRDAATLRVYLRPL